MIAIVHRKGSFSERWIAYCEKYNIKYKIVNPYDSNIVQQIKEDCDVFMWHHSHGDYRDLLFAKQLIFSLESAGIRCFPDMHTTWHFDDKVGQKYLLESIGAPLVASYVCYSKKESVRWINDTSFPKVFKLRGGAGASNVRLVKNKTQARHLVRKSFGRGFPTTDFCHLFSDAMRKWMQGHARFYDVEKYAYMWLRDIGKGTMMPKQKGYVYFQDFIPDNLFDIRVVVVADKAFAIKRMVRKNDFRASGSGAIVYERTGIDERCVKIAFNVCRQLHLQCAGMDFVFDRNNNPLIVEISYGFTAEGYSGCPGYWTRDMQWHEGSGFDFCGWMVESLLNDQDVIDG